MDVSVWAGVTWEAMQGHLPGPPQPHFPEAWGRSSATWPPASPDRSTIGRRRGAGWADVDGRLLDEFDDVGDWEPMHRPVIQVTAVSCQCRWSSPAWAPCSSCCCPHTDGERVGAANQVRPATTRRPAATAARSPPGLEGPARLGRHGGRRGRPVVVVEGAEVVVVVVVVEDAENATMRLAAGARRRPAPTDGVGKWLAGAPMVACSRTAPVAGSSP